MKYTDVAWDFDGTLFDSYPNCARAFSEMLKSFGYDESPETVKPELMITVRHALQLFGDKYGLDQKEMKRRYKEYEGFRPDLVKPMPGAEEVLKKVRDSGRRNHLYTNRNRDAVRYLDAYGLSQYFDSFVTSEKMERLKPDPCGAFLLKENFRIEQGKLLMVGDRELDLTPVKAAGFDGCFLDSGSIPVPECADIVIYRLIDLMNHL